MKQIKRTEALEPKKTLNSKFRSVMSTIAKSIVVESVNEPQAFVAIAFITKCENIV